MSKKVKIIIISIISLILVAVLALIVLEETGKRKIRIVNNTDKNIKGLEVFFETEDEGIELYSLYNAELKSGQKYSASTELFDFENEAADLAMIVTFEGEEGIFVYDGYFYDRFDGAIDIEFYQAEGEYRARMSATSGLFRNTVKSGMKDDEIYFDFEESDWDFIE